MSEPAKLAYERAPDGSPDKFRLTEPALFTWRNPPAWVWALCKVPVHTPDGAIQRTLGADGVREIQLYIYEGFFFAVSIAPNVKGAVEGSCPHDLVYKHVALPSQDGGYEGA